MPDLFAITEAHVIRRGIPRELEPPEFDAELYRVDAPVRVELFLSETLGIRATAFHSYSQSFEFTIAIQSRDASLVRRMHKLLVIPDEVRKHVELVLEWSLELLQ